jgi:hypothetical protein
MLIAAVLTPPYPNLLRGSRMLEKHILEKLLCLSKIPYSITLMESGVPQALLNF